MWILFAIYACIQTHIYTTLSRSIISRSLLACHTDHLLDSHLLQLTGLHLYHTNFSPYLSLQGQITDLKCAVKTLSGCTVCLPRFDMR